MLQNKATYRLFYPMYICFTAIVVPAAPQAALVISGNLAWGISPGCGGFETQAIVCRLQVIKSTTQSQFALWHDFVMQCGANKMVM